MRRAVQTVGNMQLVLVVLALLAGARADVNVMKDVTLGFGQALDQCRQEVTANNIY